MSTSPSTPQPAVFFDRDGVINCSPQGPGGYVLAWEDFIWNPGIVESLQKVKEKGYLTVLVTNQQCVGKGLISEAELNQIHAQMQAVLHQNHAAFDLIQACTCLDGTEGCDCRKPSPTMLFKAASQLNLDLKGSWMIGDQDGDMKMAAAAGLCTRIRMQSDKPINEPADFLVANAQELTCLFEEKLPSRV